MFILIMTTSALGDDTSPEARADQLYRIGLDKANTGNCAGAIEALRDGIKADSDRTNSNTPTAFFIIANCEVHLNEFGPAVADYGAAIALKPDYALAYANRSRIRDAQGDHANALSDINAALQITRAAKPQDPALYSTRGMIEFELGQSDAALDDLNIAVGLSSKDSEALLDRAIVEVAKGALRQALSDADTVLSISPGTAKALEVRGLAEAKLGSKAAAEVDFTDAINDNVADPSAYAERASIYLGLKDYAAAKADLDRAISSGKTQPSWFYNRAVARYNLGDLAGARSDVATAVASGDRDEQAFVLEGAVNERSGDHARAVAAFTSAIAANPASGDHYYDRAFSHYLAHEMEAAFSDVRTAVRLKTEKPALRLKAIIEVQSGDLRHASSDFSLAILQNPRDAEAYLRRGLVRTKLHDRHGAVSDEREALKLALASGDSGLAFEARAQLKNLGQT